MIELRDSEFLSSTEFDTGMCNIFMKRKIESLIFWSLTGCVNCFDSKCTKWYVVKGRKMVSISIQHHHQWWSCTSTEFYLIKAVQSRRPVVWHAGRAAEYDHQAKRNNDEWLRKLKNTHRKKILFNYFWCKFVV